MMPSLRLWNEGSFVLPPPGDISPGVTTLSSTRDVPVHPPTVHISATSLRRNGNCICLAASNASAALKTISCISTIFLCTFTPTSA